MFLGYFIIFVLGGTLGFVIACILGADRNIRERSISPSNKASRFDRYS